MDTNFRATAPLIRDTVPMTKDLTEAWVEKARRRAEPTLQLAGDVADAAPVALKVIEDSDQWPFGNFMLAWLDASSPERHICHLPDGSFFLKLLARTYGPVFARRPELAELLYDGSRPEMSLTNDVLQIQLRGLEDGYSMVRHHALMLFHATLWLDEPRRTGWLDLYDEVVAYADRRPGGRPDLTELAEVEKGAFQDFVALAPRTLDPADAEALLHSEHELDRIVDYQLYSAVAIGLLWREYRQLPEDAREAWQHEHLANLYRQPDYLNEEWTAQK